MGRVDLGSAPSLFSLPVLKIAPTVSLLPIGKLQSALAYVVGSTGAFGTGTQFADQLRKMTPEHERQLE
jgi:hypothetical protein